ncbi:MAG: flagellar hook-associated protein FlgK [Gammaproteobacteria bacterium]|nr:MAG: flagellar hook-associated protein FlgK [Gammaproteobacteria bacterium]
MANAGLLGVGISGLLSFQRALTTISHNISNANTEGYSRQRVELSTRPPQRAANGYMGQGVKVDDIRRMVSEFANAQIQSSTSSYKHLRAFYDLSSQVDNMLADQQTGLAPTLQGFFEAMQDVADDPVSLPARQVLLSEAGSLVNRFRFLDQRLENINQDINSQLRNIVSDVNSYARAIADVNRDISMVYGNGTGQLPNDLLDRRDQLVRELAEQVSVTTVLQDNGALNVFIGNGQTLVVGDKAQTIAVINNQYDAAKLEVGYVASVGTISISNQLSGGKLGGVLEFRSRVVESSENALGRVALGLARTFNDQNRLGADLNGALGGNFFNDIDQSSPRVLPNINNGGAPMADISVSVTDVSALTVSDYRLDYDGASFALTRISDNTVVTSLAAGAFTGGTPLTADGISLSYNSGGFAIGDNFLVQPTARAARDIDLQISNPSEVAAAAPIRSSADINNIGSGEISAGSVVGPPPTNADLQQTVTITFTSPTTYDITGVGAGLPSVGNVYNPSTGVTLNVNGWTADLTGAPASGDQFVMTANTNGVSDNRNALLLSGLQSAASLLAGANFQSAYGQLVADVGVATREADVTSNAQKIMLDQSVAQRESVSGVNLDEEAANLVRYQQAYQAAAQVISTANDLFDILLGAVRR